MTIITIVAKVFFFSHSPTSLQKSNWKKKLLVVFQPSQTLSTFPLLTGCCMSVPNLVLVSANIGSLGTRRRAREAKEFCPVNQLNQAPRAAL